MSLVCYESNYVDSHHNNTWWIDSGSTIHVSTVMQGFLSLRKPNDGEHNIYSGNKMCSKVEGVGTYRLVLHTGYTLDLERVFYIPSFSKNLVSVSRLVPHGFNFQFMNSSFLILKDSVTIGSGSLIDGLYRLSLHVSFEQSMMSVQGSVIKKNSSMLWHRRLEHISIDRLKQLVRE